MTLSNRGLTPHVFAPSPRDPRILVSNFGHVERQFPGGRRPPAPRLVGNVPQVKFGRTASVSVRVLIKETLGLDPPHVWCVWEWEPGEGRGRPKE